MAPARRIRTRITDIVSPQRRRSVASTKRTAVISTVLIGVAVAGVGYADMAGTAPAYAASMPSQLSAEAAAEAAAQADADALDRQAIRDISARAAIQDAELAAQRQQEAAEAAARAQAEAEAAFRREQLSVQAQADPKGAAQAMLADHGWDDEQFVCLDKLWTRESNWIHTADNPTSSAYGIPQALPGKKMATEGADWETNPATQIRWGLGYIADVYGSPCKAWAHSEATNWY